GEHPRAAADLPLEPPERLAAPRRNTQRFIDCLCSGYAALDGEHDAGGEDRIDECVGVSHQEEPVTVRTAAGVRIVSGSLDAGRERGGLQAFGERRGEGDRL